MDRHRDGAGMAGRADCQQGGNGHRAGCPNAGDAGAACRVRLDCTGCGSCVCVAAAKLLGEVRLLALACDDEDSAPGERGAVGELNAVKAPVVVHEAADTLCLDCHPGGLGVAHTGRHRARHRLSAGRHRCSTG